ncbi:MAG: L-2-hydroxyglutarate oxidase [Pseudomonadales bacterium]
MYDYIVVGGGIIGLSTAWQLQQRQPQAKIVLLEKETSLAQHQTGHNSGVIHAGIYYEPGSLKANFCTQGAAATITFCERYGIPFEQCGKLLVATTELEQTRMFKLHERALRNGLDVELLDTEQLRAREPNIVGLGAIFLRSTGIVDYRLVCEQMAACFRELGGNIQLATKVTGLSESNEQITVRTHAGANLNTRYLVVCAGLMADRTAQMLDIKVDFQIIPFRGEYYQLPPSKNDVVSHLIYPIPDPDLPFLGVHLTRMIDGSVTVGPNAVQGWKREGYGRININLRDVWDMLRFPGFWKAIWANLSTGLVETFNSWWKPGYLKMVQKYCPTLNLADLKPYPAGVRAQAVLRDGSLVEDFLFAESARSLHVCNAPSPAATSAIPIGAYIVDRVAQSAATMSE